MQNVGIIPARFHSTRFPGKALADLLGKPMIVHIWERAIQAECLDRVIIATDDPRIREAAEIHGAPVVMTSPEAPSGTDRIAEAAADLDAAFITNIQGDEPLITADMIEAAAGALAQAEDCQMSTLRAALRDEAELYDPNVVKVITDRRDRALYFSRLPLPYSEKMNGFPRAGQKAPAGPFSLDGYFKHVGLYCYRKSFLLAFAGLRAGFLEETEKLEQLRVLENGYRIAVAFTNQDPVGVDTPEDLNKVIALLKEREAKET
jgi:3-deoxy-manno-octulosonate cytidylyltransferase (CMP-KDO synthetase)